jgi:post-segregation antitoxin (ccd killing protein)
MPKITVYLPDDLATDVKAAGISVSPVCQRALEEEVKKMKALRAWRDDERLAAARERLLATTAHEDLDLGRQQGREWALQMADQKELRRIASLVEGQVWYPGATWAAKPFDNKDEWPTAAAWLYGPKTEFDDPDDWEAFLDGFVLGAAEVWDAIKAGA